MTPERLGEGVTLHMGDCLDVLTSLPDASIDAVVTDPPYGLAEHPVKRIEQALTAWLTGDRAHVPDGRGFMGREWDKFVPPPAAWDECYRVLKPGGHLLAFSASRTYDLMGISIRLAGFDVFDSIDWINGQGFPKSLDVSKAIDKAAGADRKVVGYDASRVRPNRLYESGAIGNVGATGAGNICDRTDNGATITAPATEDAARWEGWGTALKPAHEPIVLARKPLDGTYAANVLKHGAGAMNINGCSVPHASEADKAESEGKNRHADFGSGPRAHNGVYQGQPAADRAQYDGSAGRWPPNILLSEEAAAEMDRQSGSIKGSHVQKPTDTGDVSWFGGGSKNGSGYADAGGASRFFPVFRYEAKAPSRERPHLPDGTAWPTVKPLGLIRWLVRLVTPPHGTVLDLFAGTGTTGEACLLEGFPCILIEKDPVAVELIRVRFGKDTQPDLFGIMA